MTGNFIGVTARTLLAALVSTTVLAGCSGGLGPTEAVGTYSATDDGGVTAATNDVSAEPRFVAADQTDDRVVAADQTEDRVVAGNSADSAPRPLRAEPVTQATVDANADTAIFAEDTETVAEAECIPRGRGQANAYAGPDAGTESAGTTWDGYPNINMLPTDNRCEFLSDSDRDAVKADLEDLGAAQAARARSSGDRAATEAELRELATTQQKKAAANAAKE